MSRARQLLGKRGEELAANYLIEHGYRIIARNYRCQLGEIDIIARDRRVLVFIEVRSNSGPCFGLPQESVSTQKRVRLRRVAEYYLQYTRVRMPVRFDVIGIVFTGDSQIDRKSVV